MKQINGLLPFTTEICERYRNKTSCAEIGKIYETSHTTILKFLCLQGIKRTRSENQTIYSLNEGYFETIDTADKAYFLGFLFADGCNQTLKNIVDLKLQQRDSYILNIFNERLGSNRPFYFTYAKNPNHQTQVCLRIKNKKLSHDLEQHGMTSQKSLTLKFPTTVPPLLIHHFVRGYFDGDGYILTPQNSVAKVCIDFCVSGAFGETLKTLLKNVGVSSALYRAKGQKIYHLHFAGRNNCLKFLNWMYQDADLYLTRKFQKYQFVKTSPKSFNLSSKYLGVYLHKKNKKYVATITVGKKQTYLGSYKQAISAARRYNEAVVKLKLNRRLNVL